MPPALPAAPRGSTPPGVPNPYTLLLQRARSEATRRTYAQNLTRFFRDEYGREADRVGPGDTGAFRAPPGGDFAEAVREFLALDAPDMAMLLARHRQRMQGAGSAAASVNVRLAAVRALVDTAFQFRLCPFGSAGLVHGTKARAYRDTRGPGMENVKKMLALPDRTTLRGKRDYALLRLLADNALRRAEVCGLAVADFDAGQCRLAVLGKGRDDKEWVDLHRATGTALREYLTAAGHTDGALFRSCAFRASAKGTPLAADGLHDIVRGYGAKIGLKLSPHKFRHTAITAALEEFGDVRKVQEFSRHKRIETVMIYDDARHNHQGEITRRLGDLLDG